MRGGGIAVRIGTSAVCLSAVLSGLGAVTAWANTPVPNTETQNLVLSPTGHTAYAIDNSSIDVVDMTTDPPSVTSNLDTGVISHLAISPDGTSLIALGRVAGIGGFVQSDFTLYNLRTNPPTPVTVVNPFVFQSVSTVAFAPSSGYALITDDGPFSGSIPQGPQEQGPGFVELLSLKVSPPTVLEQVPVGWDMQGIAIAPNGTSAWVLNHGLGSSPGPLQLTRLDLTTFPIAVGPSVTVSPIGVYTSTVNVVLSPGGGTAYVAGSAVDLTQTPPVVKWTAPDSVTQGPNGVNAAAVTPDGRFVYFQGGRGPGFIADTSISPPAFSASFPAGCGQPVVAPDGTFVLCGVLQRDPIVPSISGVSPSTGPPTGGTQVTITGSNLAGASAVDFGSSPGTAVTVNSAGTQLTVTTPPGTGTVPVSVTTAGGTSAPLPAATFTYPLPVPAILAMNYSTGPAAGGIGILIAGTNLNGATEVDFGPGNPATILAASKDGMFVAVTLPPGTGPVDVRVTTPGGTSPVVPADRFTYRSTPAQIQGVSPAHGPAAGGTGILLIGSGFVGATKVEFGSGHPGTIEGVSSDGVYMAVTAPAGAGVVDITVTTPEGTSTIVPADKYTYVDTPPVVSSLSPQSGSSAGGTGVLVTGSGFTGATSVRFGLNPGFIEGISTDGRLIAVVAPPGVGTVDVTVTGPEGTSAVTPGDRFMYTGA